MEQDQIRRRVATVATLLLSAAHFAACTPPRPAPPERPETPGSEPAGNPGASPGAGGLAPQPGPAGASDAGAADATTVPRAGDTAPAGALGSSAGSAGAGSDAGSIDPGPDAPPAALPAVTDEQLCITQGTVAKTATQRLAIATPKMRAVVRDSAGDRASLRFTYRGPTDEVALLASGVLRRQLGLKLRAADTCNLVTVMWRIAPRAEIVVSIKRNRGLSAHAQCGAEGFVTIEAIEALPPPALVPGDSHTLEAEIVGEELVVRIDGQKLWRGNVGQEVWDLRGWSGMQTDNVALEAELYSRSQPLPGGARSPCPEPES